MISKLPEKLEHGVNCYINPEDILESLNMINSGEVYSLRLLIVNPTIIPELKKIEYDKFLLEIINNVQLDESCYSIYASRIEKKELDKIQEQIVIERKNTKVEFDEINLCINVTGSLLIINLIYGILSQVHETSMQMTGLCLQFKAGGLNVYPNVRGNSALENYAQYWCFEKIVGEVKLARGSIVW